MSKFSFKSVHIEACAVDLPPYEVSSSQIEERLAPIYDRLEVPYGTLERLSGIKTRYFYDQSVTPSQAGISACRKAISQIGFDPQNIQAIFNCSVTRDHFEPATASIIHKALGIAESSISLDISNACLGFSNGIMLLGNLIESGVVKAGILVSGETISKIIDTSITKMLAQDEMNREELLRLLPTFTLGSGAVAFVLCHESIATKPHRVLGGVSRSASEYSHLCVGNADYCFYMDEDELNPIMHTDSPKLIGSAAYVGQRAWQEFQQSFECSNEDFDAVFCHQVGKQLGDSFFKTMGVDNSKEFSIYQRYGNQVSAALPSTMTLGLNSGMLKSGGKALLTGFGSGLNAIFTAVSW